MKRGRLGFQQAMEYVLDLLCYAYYCKSDTLVSDVAFDELEKIYSKLSGFETSPQRGQEDSRVYSNGVKFVYELLKKKEGK